MMRSKGWLGFAGQAGMFLLVALWGASRLASAQSNTPTPVAPYAACQGAPESQLAVGSWGVVNPALKVSLNLRTKPAQTAAALGLMTPGEWSKVIGGPQCADGFAWWKVQSLKTNLTGWVAEGDAAGYWLVPPPPPTATPTPKPTRTPTSTPNYTGTRQAAYDSSTATVAAGRARATGIGQTATAARQTAVVQQTATAGAMKAYATRAVQSARATLQAFNIGQTATAQAAPARTAQALIMATAARATYVSQLTAQAQATRDTGTQRAAQATSTRSAQLTVSAELVGAQATLDAGYRYVAYYDSIAGGGKIRFRAYVASLSGQEVQAYTSAPRRVVLVELVQGLDPAGLKVSSTIAYTFYGESTGWSSRCDGYGCREVPHVIEATWLP